MSPKRFHSTISQNITKCAILNLKKRQPQNLNKIVNNSPPKKLQKPTYFRELNAIHTRHKTYRREIAPINVTGSLKLRKPQHSKGSSTPQDSLKELNKEDLFILKDNVENGPLLNIFKTLVKESHENKNPKPIKDKKKFFECSKCSKKFTYQLRYINHISNNCKNNQNKPESALSGPNIEDLEPMEEHPNEINWENLFLCKNCKSRFKYLANLKKHMKICSSRNKKVKNLQKKDADASISHPKKVEMSILNLLSNHSIIPNENNASALNTLKKINCHSCDVCFKIFFNYFNMIKHRLSHKLGDNTAARA